MDDLQFYPTPFSLAQKAWAKFQDRNFSRVLEPSAGMGDLIKAMPYFASTNKNIDACEINIETHPVLRNIGAKIVGSDFMNMNSLAIYSHIIQNPPFHSGVDHVLKAWYGIFDGEIVSIINAETIKNPYSRERQLLVGLIEQHGSVEYVQDSFSGPDSGRKTNVEVAIVYLRKQSNVDTLIASDIIGELKRETLSNVTDTLSGGYDQPQELSVPTSVIENFVIVFDTAVNAMRDAVISEARANRYATRIGVSLSDMSDPDQNKKSVDSSVKWVKNEIASRYSSLKERAWSNVLRSTQVSSKLSSSAQKRIESEFIKISELEFSITNIQGFLRGLVENSSKIMIDMVCDVFDSITKYHTDNIVFYKGWRSNDKHRTCGFRIKTTRFVLPGFNSYSSGLQYEGNRRLDDFDRVFAMLDGKSSPEIGLTDIFSKNFQELRSGERVFSSYFSVRFYPASGTIHFFARDKELIEKFNMIVGQHRKWLPPSDVKASSDFWKQFKSAEKFDKEIRAQLEKDVAGTKYTGWRHPLRNIFGADKEETLGSNLMLEKSILTVLEKNNISTDFQLGYESEPDTLLLAA